MDDVAVLCTHCKQIITVQIESNGDTQSEWQYQKGHSRDCFLYKVEDNDDAVKDRINRSNKI